jgi:hypothetical protein
MNEQNANGHRSEYRSNISWYCTSHSAIHKNEYCSCARAISRNTGRFLMPLDSMQDPDSRLTALFRLTGRPHDADLMEAARRYDSPLPRMWLVVDTAMCSTCPVVRMYLLSDPDWSVDFGLARLSLNTPRFQNAQGRASKTVRFLVAYGVDKLTRTFVIRPGLKDLEQYGPVITMKLFVWRVARTLRVTPCSRRSGSLGRASYPRLLLHYRARREMLR